MKNRTRSNDGFIIPSILACLVVTSLAVALLGSLLAQQRMRTIEQHHISRARIRAQNNAKGAKPMIIRMRFTTPSSPQFWSVLGEETTIETTQRSLSVSRKKNMNWPFRSPLWSSFKEDFPQTAQENYYFEESLSLENNLSLHFQRPGEHTIAVLGSLSLQKGFSIDATNDISLVLVAVGDILLAGPVEISGRGAIHLSLISLTGSIVVKPELLGWNFCHPTNNQSQNRFFASATRTITIGKFTRIKMGSVGCQPTLSSRYWPNDITVMRISSN